MTADDGTRTTVSGQEPAPPPVDPADRPTIEPSDALPTEAPPVPASGHTSGEEPTPPPVDPADRPTIEPGDALPTEE